VADQLLQEDGSLLVLESGGGVLLLESGTVVVPGTFLLQEDGFKLELEDAEGFLLLETASTSEEPGRAHHGGWRPLPQTIEDEEAIVASLLLTLH